MRFLDEFRDPRLARALTLRIATLGARAAARRGRALQIMEFCGGHTHTIFRYGIEQMLPPEVELVHGPGCPVCVLPLGRIDDALALAMRPEVIFTTFGDAMRVPGSQGSLLQAKGAGADVRMVYSPLDALRIARDNPRHEVVFFALGFETTMPSTALTVLQAEREGIDNFSLLCNHIATAPTLRAVLDDPGPGLDAFLAPGHVSMVTGLAPFEFVAREYGRPIVVTGFEPLDVLQSLWMVLRQLDAGRAEVENQYARVVARQGNTAALQAMARVFEPGETARLRGLGAVGESGFRLRASYAGFDAERRMPAPRVEREEPAGCQCGEVLRGALQPRQCRMFGRGCDPANPLGALMVSSEGACAAYYNYRVREPEGVS
jgi:hydrogenase expression/formation protein HypD